MPAHAHSRFPPWQGAFAAAQSPGRIGAMTKREKQRGGRNKHRMLAALPNPSLRGETRRRNPRHPGKSRIALSSPDTLAMAVMNP
jgi:hypothetical protein